LEDRVLIKGQNQSEAANGVIDKFMHMYQGPYIINKILPPATYQIVENKGKFNKGN
jgi:hypothetical protein